VAAKEEVIIMLAKTVGALESKFPQLGSSLLWVRRIKFINFVWNLLVFAKRKAPLHDETSN
jgi:hypothetical protein